MQYDGVNMTDLDAIMAVEDADDEETYYRGLQASINSGTCWHMQGSIGRAAADAIKAGVCALGPERRRDYYGNVVPARSDMADDRPGSAAYVEAHSPFGGLLE